jgi:3-isopropylmalate/(R)-2-methylmalate dehydratase small subunit
VPLRRSNVDTDQIIPAVYLKRVTRTGFEDGLFAAWRGDPDFVLNPRVRRGLGACRRTRLRHRLVARARRLGAAELRLPVVISPRFADIFRGNSGKAGLLAAQVDEKVVGALWSYLEANPGATITVDLETKTVKAGEGPDAIEDSFDIDDYTRWRLLEGLDDIGITLGHEADISAFETERPAFKPVTL